MSYYDKEYFGRCPTFWNCSEIQKIMRMCDASVTCQITLFFVTLWPRALGEKCMLPLQSLRAGAPLVSVQASQKGSVLWGSFQLSCFRARCLPHLSQHVHCFCLTVCQYLLQSTLRNLCSKLSPSHINIFKQMAKTKNVRTAKIIQTGRLEEMDVTKCRSLFRLYASRERSWSKPKHTKALHSERQTSVYKEINKNNYAGIINSGRSPNNIPVRRQNMRKGRGIITSIEGRPLYWCR